MTTCEGDAAPRSAVDTIPPRAPPRRSSHPPHASPPASQCKYRHCPLYQWRLRPTPFQAFAFDLTPRYRARPGHTCTPRTRTHNTCCAGQRPVRRASRGEDDRAVPSGAPSHHPSSRSMRPAAAVVPEQLYGLSTTVVLVQHPTPVSDSSPIAASQWCHLDGSVCPWQAPKTYMMPVCKVVPVPSFHV